MTAKSNIYIRANNYLKHVEETFHYHGILDYKMCINAVNELMRKKEFEPKSLQASIIRCRLERIVKQAEEVFRK